MPKNRVVQEIKPMSEKSFDVGSFVGDILGIVGDVGMNLYNAKVMKDINEQNHDWALQAENRERAYNSPEQQMLRLKKAGLNPNLIYGSGASTGNLNARTATAEAPQMSLSFLDRLRAAREMKLQNKQMENIEAQTKLTETKTDIADAEARIAKHDANVIESRPGVSSKEDGVDSIVKDLADAAKHGASKVGKLIGKIPLLRDVREWWFEE